MKPFNVMPAWDKCSSCPFQAWGGRCSFNRLIGEAILRNLIVDYIETPTYIKVVCPDVSFYCDPEDAHAVMCNLLRRSTLTSTPGLAYPRPRPESALAVA